MSASPRRALRLELIALGAFVVAAAALFAMYALRVGTFQPDENYYIELARFISRHFPTALWQSEIYWKGIQRLDALILAIPLSLMRGPGAFELAHVIHASLFASTAIPAWLLARGAGLGRPARMLVAALSIVIPWAVVSTSFLVESSAYPAYAWVLYATWRTAARPTRLNEVMAIVALIVAALCRTQLLALTPIVPAAVVWQEARCGAAGLGVTAGLRQLPRRLVSRHPLIAVGTAGVLLALVLNEIHVLPEAVVGQLTRGYGLPHFGTIHELLARDRYYLARMAAGTGFVTGALGGAWVLRAFVRPRTAPGHALAVTCTLGIVGVLLGLLAAGPDERYVVYGTVPIALAFAAALEDGVRVPRARVGYAASVIAGALATILLIDSVTWPAPAGPYDYFTYPADAFYSRVVTGRLSELSLPLVHIAPDRLLEAGIAVVALAWLAAVLRFRRATRAGATVLGVGALALCAAQMFYAEEQFTTSAAAAAGGPSAAQRSWVDRHVPAGARVAAISVGLGETTDFFAIWRTLEFWNSSIQEAGYFTSLGPLPVPLGNAILAMVVNPVTGVIEPRVGPAFVAPYPAPRYVLMPRVASLPVGLATVRVQEDPVMLVNLETLSMPARLQWRLTGISSEGFLAPGQPATATIYRSAFTGGSRCARLVLTGPPNFRGRWRYTVASGIRTLAHGTLAAQQSQPVTVPLTPHMVSGSATAVLTIDVHGAVPYPNGQTVSASLGGFAVGACPA